MTAWRNRIVSTGEAAPDDLLAHPDNWRVHSERQQRALGGSLDEIGWVQEVIVNTTTGHLLDGHLRVMLAMRRGDKTVPVTYVELTEAEERLALATLDPVTGMAHANAHVFAQLLEHANTGNPDLMEYLDQFAQEIGAVPTGEEKKPQDRAGATEHGQEDFTGFKHTCPCCHFQFDP